ncbi:lysine biosynthesis protein LysW [Streptomyces sp. BE308]|uniref:Lysine biosynthesis protein LysW n=3 Tax=Streptomyces TaxID=1883 RepID=A0A5N8VYV9_9ACTN|nr:MULTISPECIES: lysine biosynthesis protein LysW [Streptomyces]MBQ0828074.1 lysine biosynthesis protein LysW [Streptomyces sp. RG38]MEE1789456.1 lysine biosynthesis protein LysW [Streptomyces sp. BE308]MPY39284.1 lysine biosynthesis protein LysW [Streptomyces phyllanthi]OKI44784.1 lysine biosynthesis protein LysW [Streptomyces sp. TSRI0281]WRZ77359.1 lysine biosynthesis protein LysW [Streptomyces sp. NBC_01237]
MVTCPECENSVVPAGTPVIGEIVECGECASELEILTLDPIRAALAPEIEEDWGE